MLSTCLALVLMTAPPEQGLAQAFSNGESFRETIDVRVASTAEDKAKSTTLHYTIELKTVTKDVESSEQALLESRVLNLLVETSIGEAAPAKYDSADRKFIGSLDGSDSEAQTLARLWSPYRDISLTRKAGTDGSIELGEISELSIDARTSPLTDALGKSLTQLVSCTLPLGRSTVGLTK